MRFLPALALSLGLAIGAVTTDCKMSAPAVSALEAKALQDGASIGACIIGQAVSGNVSAVGIGLACGVPAGIDVLGLCAQLALDLESGNGDAGKAGSGLSDLDRARIVVALRAVK